MKKILVVLVLLVSSVAMAHNKVVVVPLTDGGPPSPVTKTGQTTSSRIGDDGYHQAGIVAPKPRFVDHGNGAVTDKLTGLIWLKEGFCIKFGTIDGSVQNSRSWSQAVGSCNILGNDYCGLGDSSHSGDWRLPNLRELQSLVDLGQYEPALPPNCPLRGFTASFGGYWSATTLAGNADYAWPVDFFYGSYQWLLKSADRYVRCVRGGL